MVENSNGQICELKESFFYDWYETYVLLNGKWNIFKRWWHTFLKGYLVHYRRTQWKRRLSFYFYLYSLFLVTTEWIPILQTRFWMVFSCVLWRILFSSLYFHYYAVFQPDQHKYFTRNLCIGSTYFLFLTYMCKMGASVYLLAKDKQYVCEWERPLSSLRIIVICCLSYALRFILLVNAYCKIWILFVQHMVVVFLCKHFNLTFCHFCLVSGSHCCLWFPMAHGKIARQF